jgi:hypothetical protein
MMMMMMIINVCLVNISDKVPFTKPRGSYVHTDPTYLQCFHFAWFLLQ